MTSQAITILPSQLLLHGLAKCLLALMGLSGEPALASGVDITLPVMAVLLVVVNRVGQPAMISGDITGDISVMGSIAGGGEPSGQSA